MHRHDWKDLEWYDGYVAIQRLEAFHGGLRVLPGSGRTDQHEHVAQLGARGRGVDVELGSDAWRGADCRMGDVLLFHALTLHHAPANCADRLRLSADYRYQSVREPILKACLDPSDHCFAAGTVVPGWDELAAGWSWLDPIAVPAGVNVVPDRG